MVRKTVWVGILASAMMIMAVGVASAAPTVTSLSSWESVVVDGNIVGGSRTMVVTNTSGAELAEHAIDLGAAPCDCAIVEVSDGQSVSGNTWAVPSLAVGETAVLTLRYASTPLRAAVVPQPPPSQTGSALWLVLAAGLTVATSVLIAKSTPAIPYERLTPRSWRAQPSPRSLSGSPTTAG